MKVTSVNITIVPNEERLKAYASIVLDDCFVVHDLKIISSNEKIFIAMPSKKHKNKNIYRDIAHPLNPGTRKMIQKAVFKQYKKMLNQLQLDETSFDSLTGLEDKPRSDSLTDLEDKEKS